jgi:hypothetical protein
MEIYSLDLTNTTPLSTDYDLDKNLQIKRNVLNTENNFSVNLETPLKNANDFSINNFSCLTLSERRSISDFLNIKPLEYLADESFTTYLAANSLNIINDNSRFWVAEEPNPGVNTAKISVSGIGQEIDNRYYFEIILLDNFRCKIAHENDGVKRFLTNSASNEILFAKDAFLDYLDVHSPQIFLYAYDRVNELIAFFKNINDIIYYVGYNSSLQVLFYVPTISGTGINFTTQTSFRCEPRQDTSNVTPLFDPWVAYQKDANNNINLEPSRSVADVESNILLSNQYANVSSISGYSLKSNILSLKNTNTPENYQSRANPFFDEQEPLQRNFTKLFTGSNQELGNDNITLGYESYTSNIVLKKDKITYFHVPQNFYPFIKLNLNDSKLAEAGAIAGDHPMKSDKIFKKKANYKFTSIFGNTELENTGSFLCSWLSGNSDFNSRPVWVDRYYFPSRVSFIGALTATTFNAVTYIPSYDCLRAQIPANIQVVDKLSDSIFEPGTYYAYYHVGEEFSANYIKYIQENLVQKNFSDYFNTQGALLEQSSPPVYSFDGNNYCVSSSLSAIQKSNQFTMIFDMYSSDWSKPFGYQILGNYSTDGFGVYNTNYLTPAFFISSLSSILITNTNFEKLNTIEISSSANALIRLDSFDDFYVLTSDGLFNKYNNRFNLIYRKYNEDFKEIFDYDYDNNFAYILGKNLIFNAAVLYKVNFSNGEVTQIDDSTADYNLYFYDVPSSVIAAARTINIRENNIYFTSGDKAERYNKNIYYKTTIGSSYIISKWNTENNSVLPSSVTPVVSVNNSLEDYELDTEGNLWVLYDLYKIAQINQNNVVVLSSFLPLSGATSTNIDFDYELEQNEIIKYVLVSALSAGKIINYKLNTLGQAISTFNTGLNGPNATSITQSSNLRYNYNDLYVGNKLNIKLKLINSINANDFTQLNEFYGLSSLSPGYHNFCFRFNSDGGTFHLIVDGKIEIQEFIEPKKYIFSNLIERPFIFGTGIYNNSITIFEYLKNNDLNTRGINLKNFYLYDKALNYFDILHIGRSDHEVEDIIFDLPCGRRNYLEEIERYFKFRVPGSKSAVLNIVLKNSGINNQELKDEIEKRILNLLADAAPAYIRINDIKWYN